MSAILAVFNRDRMPVDRVIIDAMMAASPDRSVDGQDIWREGHVALAHQHFWITKEELNERQPLNDNGHLIITADARLDNRDTLISQLGIIADDGQCLSDAALILRAYEQWREACVDHLLGDFAFTIWDSKEQCLFMARDALGTRGLCYHINHARCLVASEVRQILAHPEIKPRINENRIAAFLAGLFDDHEETFVEDVFYCPPAHCMVVSGNEVRKWRYWDVDPHAKVRFKDDREYAERFSALLTEAVQSRLRTVGTVGVSMSGGLDSTSLAAVIAKLRPQERLRSYSYAFDELISCDERQYIRPVVERLHLDATYMTCDDKWTLRDLNSWPGNRGFVLSDPYPRLPESAAIAAQQAGCRVLFAGYYGDVLFTGGRFWAADMMRELRLKELAEFSIRQHSDLQWRLDLWRHGIRQLIPLRLKHAYRRLNPPSAVSAEPGLDADLIMRTGLQDRLAGGRLRNGVKAPGQWQRYQAMTLNIFAQGASATRHEYNRYGLELITPYWDRRLVEFAMALPADQLGRPGRDRHVLRNAMSDQLPRSVVEPRKRTIFLPLMEKGLLHREKATVERLMQDPQVVKRRFVRADWLREQLHGDYDWLNSANAIFIWKTLSLELWLQRYW